MCGIFGIVTDAASPIPPGELRNATRSLMRLSESRGKEAAGIALMDADSIRVFKQPVSGAEVFRAPACRDLFELQPPSNGRVAHGVTVIGHTRLATDGGLEQHDNNQPVIRSGIVGIHNGIIVNGESLWRKYPQLQRSLSVDTEVILALLRHFLDSGESLPAALRHVFAEVYGVANVALLLKERRQLVLATNNGSLYIARAPGWPVFVFASEAHILKRFLGMRRRSTLFDGLAIEHLPPGTACTVDTVALTSDVFTYDRSDVPPDERVNGFNRQVLDVSGAQLGRVTTRLVATRQNAVPAWVDREWEKNRDAIAKLRRCSRCVLPETVPFLEFDEHGVCSDCRAYVPRTSSGRAALEQAVAPFRRADGRPDVLMPLSGGRDSCYTLHYVKRELGLNPLAYTYDWGMVTDLARRNQSRLCSKLGIEHIWVSANIARKRENICKNVSAWLRRPDMGLIPLFMAGDKQFFHFAEKVATQNELELTVFSMNSLEDTDFKSGYCGIRRGVRADYPGSSANLRMVRYYLRAFLRNPRYLNSSLADTAWAYVIYYMSPVHRRYLTFEDFIAWDEDTIISTLRNEYDWELSPDTTTTWRIGDGTAPFYNYIYYTVGGFTEIDTFRSNQIRVGTIDRDTALRLVQQESTMRYDSIQWYCETIGIDIHDALRAINAAPKRYPVE